MRRVVSSQCLKSKWVINTTDTVTPVVMNDSIRKKLKEHRPSSNTVNTFGKLILCQYIIALNSSAEAPSYKLINIELYNVSSKSSIYIQLQHKDIQLHIFHKMMNQFANMLLYRIKSTQENI